MFEPGVILGQMQLRNFVMLKVFLSAVATGLVLLAALHGLGVVTLHPRATLVGADLAGGLLLGIGITLAGACPGTVAAQIGAGYKDAWLTLGGGLLGALAFAYCEPVLEPVLLSGGPGRLTLDVVTGVPFWVLALMSAGALGIILLALERRRSWREEIGGHADGRMIDPSPGASLPDGLHRSRA